MAGAGALLRPLARPGLVLTLSDGWRSLAVALAAGLAVGLVISLSDVILFHPVIPAVQRAASHDWPLIDRIVSFGIGAVLDELVLRLVGLSLILTLLVAWRGKRTGRVDAMAIALTATVLWPFWAQGYLVDLDWSALTVLREIILHVGAGSVWGWLYCRHGWMAGVVGHVSAHLVMQPLLPWVVG